MQIYFLYRPLRYLNNIPKYSHLHHKQQYFIDFMKRLVKDTDRKVLLIVDNLKVHHGKIVAECLSEHKEEIELFFTPYSPERNPYEYLNHSLKQNIHSGILPHTKEQIRKKTEDFMQEL